MNRTLRNLGLACVVLSVVLLVLFYKQVPRPQQPFKNAPQTDAFDLSMGTQTVHMVHASSWTVQVGALQLPADQEKVKSFLSSLEMVRVEDPISDRADRAAAFETDDAHGIKVSLSQKGAKKGEGIFGKQASDFIHIYFRYPGQASVYLARGLIRGELEPVSPNGWRSHDILDIAEADIQSISLSSSGRAVSLSRSSDTWTMNGRTVDASRVYALLGTLAHLKADDFFEVGTVPLHGETQITIQTAHGQNVLHIGQEDPATHRTPLLVDGGVSGFWVMSDRIKPILVKPSDFSPKSSS